MGLAGLRFPKGVANGLLACLVFDAVHALLLRAQEALLFRALLSPMYEALSISVLCMHSIRGFIYTRLQI